MAHVLVAGKIHDAGTALLRDAGFSLRVIEEITTESYAPHVREADALLIRTQPLTGPVVAAAERLKIVSRHGVGYDAVDVSSLEARNIPLTIVGDVNAIAVAEHTLACLLVLAKRLRDHDAGVRNGNWGMRNAFGGTELRGKTLVLVGFGRVGRAVARLASAFGMAVAAYDPFARDEVFAAEGATRLPALDAGLGIADYLSLHLPKSGAAPLLGAVELARMKPGACLVNTARGGLVDEPALVAALDNGRLRGAALDVFEAEPPAVDGPLMRSGKVVLTPHVAGLTIESAQRMSEASAQNIVDFFAGNLDPALVVNDVRLGGHR